MRLSGPLLARRHVVLPQEIAQHLPKNRLLDEVSVVDPARRPPARPWARPPDQLFGPAQHEWRGLGVQQSRGWVHYAIHRPEPHIMLFRWVDNGASRAAASARNGDALIGCAPCRRRSKGYGQPGQVAPNVLGLSNVH